MGLGFRVYGLGFRAPHNVTVRFAVEQILTAAVAVLWCRQNWSAKLSFSLLDVPTTIPPSSKMGSITVPVGEGVRIWSVNQ